MKRLSVYFFTGLITILPVALTIYLLYVFLVWTENVALGLLRPFIGGFYVPGMGLALGVISILLIGYLVTKQRVRTIVAFMERPFMNTPVIKSIYSSLKSFADYFSPNSGKPANQQVVVLRVPGQPIEVVGLVTRTGTEGLPEGFLPGARVAVYLPMGYMIGGYTIFVPSEWVQPLEMSVEEAMRSSLIAWMASSESRGGNEEAATNSEVAAVASAAAAGVAASAARDDGDAHSAPTRTPEQP
ncbi:DUF502 domain-containing protein [Verticiella sediminum]|uniref:DUF502 domain-containing protein n=1 Tax=Verticiella sediminum TaxID=1247510 RepID=A0A556AZ09_9BURK|nr:DUF502 domain-containing protein [Verticiella sediminum]TSH98180.1 DUF502 domain-containing protein [Verticiella sediminum]